MLRAYIRPIILVLAMLSVSCALAEQPIPANSRSADSVTRLLFATVTPAVHAEATAVLHWTLPPEEKPKTRWPWWARILAVIGVLFFIRIVAGAVRNKPSGPGPV